MRLDLAYMLTITPFSHFHFPFVAFLLSPISRLSPLTIIGYFLCAKGRSNHLMRFAYV